MVFHLPFKNRNRKMNPSKMIYAVAKIQDVKSPQLNITLARNVGITMTTQETITAAYMANRVSPAPFMADAKTIFMVSNSE